MNARTVGTRPEGSREILRTPPPNQVARFNLLTSKKRAASSSVLPVFSFSALWTAKLRLRLGRRRAS